jgi:ankyrin repeat protein
MDTLSSEVLDLIIDELDDIDYVSCQIASSMFDVLSSHKKFMKMNSNKSPEYAVYINHKDLYDHIKSKNKHYLLSNDEKLMMYMDDDEYYMTKNDGSIDIACCHGNMEMLEHIRFTNEQLFDQSKMNGLYWATMYGHLNVIKYLMSVVDLDSCNMHGTIFTTACIFGDLEIVKYYHDTFTIDLNVVPDYRYYSDVTNASVNITRTYGASVNIAGTYGACNGGSIEVLDYLLTNMGVQISDYHLLFACQGGHVDMVKYVLSFNLIVIDANIEVRAVNAAMNYGHLEVIKYLYEIGFGINRFNLGLKGPNHLAIYKYLIPLLTLTNMDKTMLLYEAVRKNNIETLNYYRTLNWIVYLDPYQYNELVSFSPKLKEFIKQKYVQPVARQQYYQPVARQQYVQPVARQQYYQPVARQKYVQPVARHQYVQPVARQQYDQPIYYEIPDY